MKIGVLGAGQLGRMLALQGYPLGLRFRFFDPTAKGPANDLAEQHAEDYRDVDALKKFAQGLDAVTYEFENVPIETARLLSDCVPHVFPPPAALEASQDRLVEKTFFNSLGIDTAPFRKVDSLDELRAAADELGLPAILKTRRMGYDGKGQFVIESADQIDAAFTALGGANLILEGFVKFDREVSILAVRNRDGDSAFYPLVENIHRGGILRISRAPAPHISPLQQPDAEDKAMRVMNALNYVGVLAIEFFESHGKLLANEMACRVHNSGHWTIEGAETSQFENHLRAGLNLPLGSTQPLGFTAMINLIGKVPETKDVLAVPGAHLHLYRKAPKPGRKLGHITLVGEDPADREERLEALLNLVE
ncbi:MAG: 5-(carboxyamino)imidazole ribonucleotide synthase [Planctomycetota bacterium]